MIKSKQRLSLLRIIAGTVLILFLGVWLYYWTNFDGPLDVFRKQEIESIHYFDALNKAVLNELPNPTDAMELVSQGTGGILSPTNVHGRILVVKYSIIDNNTATLDDTLNFYKHQLAEMHWEMGEEIRMEGYYSLTYSHATSCVKIVALYGGTREFMLEIWHDFLSQEFSPSLPPAELLYNWDMGKTDIVTCP